MDIILVGWIMLLGWDFICCLNCLSIKTRSYWVHFLVILLISIWSFLNRLLFWLLVCELFRLKFFIDFLRDTFLSIFGWCWKSEVLKLFWVFLGLNFNNSSFLESRDNFGFLSVLVNLDVDLSYALVGCLLLMSS